MQVGSIIKSADLLAPSLQGGFDYDLNALASLIRDWSSESCSQSRHGGNAVDSEKLLEVRFAGGDRTTLWHRDYFDLALTVGNLNSHRIVPTFEKQVHRSIAATEALNP